MNKLSFLILSLFSIIGHAQMKGDSITLLNGHTYWGTNTKVEGAFLTTTVQDKKGEYELNLELERVFSINNAEGERVFYEQDELQGDYLNVTESRETTWGSRDARITSDRKSVV